MNKRDRGGIGDEEFSTKMNWIIPELWEDTISKHMHIGGHLERVNAGLWD